MPFTSAIPVAEVNTAVDDDDDLPSYSVLDVGWKLFVDQK